MSKRSRTVALLAMIVAVVVIIVLDITTGLWQNLVVISGIATGLVTFGLTVLFIDRVMARSTHERWAPVTQLALSDTLHALADEEPPSTPTAALYRAPSTGFRRPKPTPRSPRSASSS